MVRMEVTVMLLMMMVMMMMIVQDVVGEAAALLETVLIHRRQFWSCEDQFLVHVVRAKVRVGCWSERRDHCGGVEGGRERCGMSVVDVEDERERVRA